MWKWFTAWQTDWRIRELQARLQDADSTRRDLEARCALLIQYRNEWKERARAAERSLRRVREGKETGWEYFAALKTAMKDGHVTSRVPYGDYDEV